MSRWLCCLAGAALGSTGSAGISGYGFEALGCDYICEQVDTEPHIQKCMQECPCKYVIHAYRPLTNPSGLICWYYEDLPTVGDQKLEFDGWREQYSGGALVIPTEDTPGVNDPATPTVAKFVVYDTVGDFQYPSRPLEFEQKWVDKRWIGIVCGGSTLTIKYTYRSP